MVSLPHTQVKNWPEKIVGRRWKWFGDRQKNFVEKVQFEWRFSFSGDRSDEVDRRRRPAWSTGDHEAGKDNFRSLLACGPGGADLGVTDFNID